MFDVENYGKRLKAARKSKKLTQKQVAEDLGITLRAYSEYERNNVIPRGIDKIVVLAEYFDVSLDWLLRGEIMLTFKTYDNETN